MTDIANKLTKNNLAIIAAVIVCGALASYFMYFGKISRAKSVVMENLKDPESAKFRNMTITKKGVCGEYDAKNGFGAYNGYEQFFVFLESEPYSFIKDLKDVRVWCKDF